MKKTLLIVTLLYTLTTYAQSPEEALRTAWFTGYGTARNLAIGGAMGSLGGDITAANVNPAGLGLFKTREWVFSPGLNFRNNQFNYRGTDTSNQQQAFQYGASGVIFGSPNRYPQNGWVSSTVALSVNQLASYRNNVSFKGYNNMSSFSEQYLEELVGDGADDNAAANNYIFGSSLAYRTYLVDSIKGTNNNLVGFRSLVPINTGVNQFYNAATSGGYHEIALAYAGNFEDKLYIGGSFTIPVINYQRNTTYSEYDATNNPNNQFGYFTYNEQFKSTGIGVGAKLGIIYKPKEFFRFGFAIHSPQIISMKDQIRSNMTTNTETYAGLKSESSDALNDGNPGIRKYNIATPWRAIASASYVFREESDTRRQRAFITGDIEFVNYRGARFSAMENSDQATEDYLKAVNNAVKNYYRGNFNFRLGGELKFNVWMFRLGGAYYGSPYASKDLPGSRWLATGGIGYRNHGFFIDVAYVYSFIKDNAFAYRLNDKPNTFATQAGNNGSLCLTFGFKF